MSIVCLTQKREFKVIQNTKFSQNREIEVSQNMRTSKSRNKRSRKFHVIRYTSARQGLTDGAQKISTSKLC